MKASSVKSRIERLERELQRLKNAEQGVATKPDFENDYFFVENGVMSAKIRPTEPRRYIERYGDSVRVVTSKCLNFKMSKDNAEDVRRMFNEAMDFYIKEVK